MRTTLAAVLLAVLFVIPTKNNRRKGVACNETNMITDVSKVVSRHNLLCPSATEGSVFTGWSVSFRNKRVCKKDWSRNINLDLIKHTHMLFFAVFFFFFFFICTSYLQIFSCQMSKKLGFRHHQPLIEEHVALNRLKNTFSICGTALARYLHI